MPAKADVDHVGRLDANGDAIVDTGFEEECVRLYMGVSEGERMNKWCDMMAEDKV